MQNFVSKLNKTLNTQLQAIDLEEIHIIEKAKQSTHCVKESLTNLKDFTSSYTFNDECEEIWFFKEAKPELFSKLIYFIKLFKIENHRPVGSREVQEKYLKNELEKLTYFQNNHLDFYRYYRSKSTLLDDKLFVRGKEDLHLFEDSLMYYLDNDFSTSHDYTVAKIMANDRLNVFLNAELETLAIKSANPNWGQLGNFGSGIQWTDNKTSLVELIYALYAAGVFNNGKCEIRELAALFEQAFNIRLNDIYRTYVEIKLRSTPTKFLDTLKSTLIHKIEEDL